MSEPADTTTDSTDAGAPAETAAAPVAPDVAARLEALQQAVDAASAHLDPDLLAEIAHGQRLDATLVGERDGSLQHPLAREGNPSPGVRLGGHPDPEFTA